METIAQVQPTADVDSRAVLGPGTTVWQLAQIREDAQLGRGCIVGRGAYVGPGVVIGDNVKLQNYALIYEPARLEDGVFIGPAAVLTNDLYPRSVDPEGKLKRTADWNATGVVIREGASLGARVVVVPGRVIGCWAMVAAGAVVTRDVPDFALVAGVPRARSDGWAAPGSDCSPTVGPVAGGAPGPASSIEAGGMLAVIPGNDIAAAWKRAPKDQRSSVATSPPIPCRNPEHPRTRTS